MSELSFSRGEDGAIVISLAGPWLLGHPRPSALEIERELVRGGVVRAAFDTRGLGRWDSGLLAFLTQVLAQCREQGIATDLSGLPAGVQRLLALAEAVPERAGPALASYGLHCWRASERQRSAFSKLEGPA